MSHTIVYRKCFLRLDGDHTTDGKTRYLPLILCGDNNVYESATGKRCRDWGSLFPRLTIPATESELIDQVKAIPDDAECFVYNSKWLHGRDMKDFVSYGIRHAKTIEELKLSSQGVSLLLYYIEKSDNGYGAHTCDMLYAKTSEDIVTWIENHRNKPIRIQWQRHLDRNGCYPYTRRGEYIFSRNGGYGESRVEQHKNKDTKRRYLPCLFCQSCRLQLVQKQHPLPN